MKNKIFVALSTFSKFGDKPLALLKNSKINYSINHLGRRLAEKEIIEMGFDASGIIAGVEPYSSNVLKNLPKLQCISRAGVGIDNIDLDYVKKNNIEIRNTPNVVIRPVAELTVAMIFDLLRKTTHHTLLMKNGRWEKVAGNLLLGKTIGIIGTGRIGKAVAELLINLDVNIRAVDIAPDHEWASKNNIEYFSFEKVLSTVDIISIHAMPPKEQLPIIGKKEISIMKKDVVLVNTSRGECIEESALIDGIVEGKIAGLGMDVFPTEPYRGKLLHFDNVVLTPHVATLTKESRLEMEIQSTQNLLNYLTKNK